MAVICLPLAHSEVLFLNHGSTEQEVSQIILLKVTTFKFFTAHDVREKKYCRQKGNSRVANNICMLELEELNELV